MAHDLPSPDSGLTEYSAYFAKLLKDVLGIEAPKGFHAAFRAQADRLGKSSYEDLGSWVLLECLEEKKEKGALDVTDVFRALDRVRHRLSRQARRDVHRRTNCPDLRVSGSETRLLKEFLEVMSDRFQATAITAFCEHFLEGRPVAAVAKDMGVSPATAYRAIGEIRKALEEFLNP